MIGVGVVHIQEHLWYDNIAMPIKTHMQYSVLNDLSLKKKKDLFFVQKFAVSKIFSSFARSFLFSPWLYLFDKKI